jgi:hypothetical protein
MKGTFEQIVSENGGQGVAAHYDFGSGGARLLKNNTPSTLQTASGEAFAQGQRERIEMSQLDTTVRFLKRCI